jgi:hypothetical protein
MVKKAFYWYIRSQCHYADDGGALEGIKSKSLRDLTSQSVMIEMVP